MKIESGGRGILAAVRSGQPAHQIAYEALRAQVLFGDLAPGASVTIEGLVRALGLGMTPVREAIRRLIAEGALQMLGNRRVCVPRLSAGAVDDLAFARETVETRLAARAFANADAGLGAELARLDAQVDAAILAGDIPAYLRSNHAFHFTLYARAGSEVLETLAASLWLRFGPSLRVICASGPDMPQPDNHKRALTALAAGDEAGFSDAIRADVVQGICKIRAALASGVLCDADADTNADQGTGRDAAII